MKNIKKELKIDLDEVYVMWTEKSPPYETYILAILEDGMELSYKKFEEYSKMIFGSYERLKRDIILRRK